MQAQLFCIIFAAIIGSALALLRADDFCALKVVRLAVMCGFRAVLGLGGGGNTLGGSGGKNDHFCPYTQGDMYSLRV